MKLSRAQQQREEMIEKGRALEEKIKAADHFPVVTQMRRHLAKMSLAERTMITAFNLEGNEDGGGI